MNSRHFWVPVVFFALVGMLLFVSGYSLYQDHRFATEAVGHTTGRVDALRQYDTSRGTIYSFNYHYAVGNSTIGVWQPTNVTVWNSLHVGDSLPLTYLEISPSISRIDWPVETANQTGTAKILFIVGALSIGLFLLSLYFCRRFPLFLRRYQLTRRGKIITPLFD